MWKGTPRAQFFSSLSDSESKLSIHCLDCAKTVAQTDHLQKLHLMKLLLSFQLNISPSVYVSNNPTWAVFSACCSVFRFNVDIWAALCRAIFLQNTQNIREPTGMELGVLKRTFNFQSLRVQIVNTSILFKQHELSYSKANRLHVVVVKDEYCNTPDTAFYSNSAEENYRIKQKKLPRITH